MDALTDLGFTPVMSTDITRTIAKRSFCTLATVSPKGRPHVAGVLYELAQGDLYVSTLRTSRKARNIAAEPHVGVCIPVRRLPVGPPSSVQLQGVAELLDPDDDRVRGLLAAGHLASITAHGELELPDGCFVRIRPPERVHTYGLGMPLRQLMRNPLDAAGSARLAPEEAVGAHPG